MWLLAQLVEKPQPMLQEALAAPAAHEGGLPPNGVAIPSAPAIAARPPIGRPRR
jgi:hypothetical protein